MSGYVTRSLENFKSAEILIENEKYYASIHCLYYSTYQIILYIIKAKLSDEWNKYQDIKIANSLNNKDYREESHNFTISFIKQNINENDENLGRIFETKIGILKKFRHTADYKEDTIIPRIANNSLNISKDINDKLIKYYQL